MQVTILNDKQRLIVKLERTFNHKYNKNLKSNLIKTNKKYIVFNGIISTDNFLKTSFIKFQYSKVLQKKKETSIYWYVELKIQGNLNFVYF